MRLELREFFGDQDNSAFKEWIDEHLDSGFYLNEQLDGGFMLHRALCDHLHDRNFDTKMATSYHKVVSVDPEELQEYCRQRGVACLRCDRAKCPDV